MFDVHAVSEGIHARFVEYFPAVAIGAMGLLAFVALMVVPGLASALLQLGLLAAALFALQIFLLAAITG